MTEQPGQVPLNASAGATADSELEIIEQSVIRAARQAGAFVSSRFGGVLEISSKGDRPGKDLVTDVDKASQNLIAGIMEDRHPDHMLLGEEDPPDEAPAAADWLWVVDPVDGTTNFVNGLPLFAVSVAALFRGMPMAAAIWVPWPNDAGYLLMHARRGNGAWNGDTRLSVRPASESGAPEAGVMSVAPGWLQRLLKPTEQMSRNFGEVRTVDSACFEQFLVARGSTQFAITGFASTWDFAAGILLVKEAGGKIMALNPSHKFEEFTGWAESYENDPATYGRTRKWRGLVLSGAPATVDFVAANLHPRKPGLLRRVKTLLGN
ncbi:MAG: inositol monophosphatase [Chloroflexi bacterium]|nr:inositol monophosphatase [Chloroflexota bacterium]